MPNSILPARNGDANAPLVLLAGASLNTAGPLLREAGYRVRTAPSAAALLRLAGSEPVPQIVLLGEAVGDQPGLSLLAQLQDNPATRHIPVLFAAGSSDDELALALGARDCLSLPLRPLVMLARVHAHMRLAALDAMTEAAAG